MMKFDHFSPSMKLNGYSGGAPRSIAMHIPYADARYIEHRSRPLARLFRARREAAVRVPSVLYVRGVSHDFQTSRRSST